jgi:hypothetical protein
MPLTPKDLRPRLAAMMLLAALVASRPAAAQWTQVAAIPSTVVYALSTSGDTLVAGSDTSAYVSTDAGATWRRSAKPVAGVTAIDAVWFRNGRLYAGTFGQGVHVSDDLGATWSAFNQGLVGGIFDSQLDVVDFQARGDSLYAATAGAGVYVRGFGPASTWAHFGEVFEPNQSSDLNSIALGSSRLMASANGNGMVFIRDSGDAEWTISNLDNIGVHAGLSPQNAVWTGTGWVVGSNLGIFSSVAGQEPWTRTTMGLGPINWTALAPLGGKVFAAFDISTAAIFERSDDNGATWQFEEGIPSVFVFDMAPVGNVLYAGRNDGLWWRASGIASVPPGAPSGRIRLALAGARPFGNKARLRFDLPAAGTARIDVFDVQGRNAGERIEGEWPAGTHEVALDARRLSPGVYIARLVAGGSQASVRLLHVR